MTPSPSRRVVREADPTLPLCQVGTMGEALGGTRPRVPSMVVRRGMTLALAGLGLGLAIALGAGRVMGGLLFGVPARDPATFAAVAALRVEPQVALRDE